MALLSLKQVSIAYGDVDLLDNVDFQLDKGERVCLVGRNGAGKSTLLKLVADEIKPDRGERHGRDIVITRLEQEVPENVDGTIFDVVAAGLGDISPLLIDYHHIIQELAQDSSAAVLARLERAQQALEAADGWSLEQRVEAVISRLSLNPESIFSALSGGMKRRVLLAKALVTEPDILLLDEPTNHLDIESIIWLETFLLNYNGTILFVTHDRLFLQALATRIVQLDRGILTSFSGDYQNYLKLREQLLANEAQQNTLFDKKLAQEESWIRQGIKARRTRNEGRVRALQQLRREYSQRRQQQGNVTMALQEAQRSGKLVIQAEQITQTFDQKVLFEDFSTLIERGDRIGIIGPNGCGKSTLISTLLGKLEPQKGHVRLGTKLQIAYYDQLRNQLDGDASVVDNVAQGSDFVEINGTRKHIMGYLQDFLFTPQRARTPVSALSGGERNRLLLAKLFSQAANLLVMDEPTNDLDAETLDLLEEVLEQYRGTLLLVSHDRSFINHIVTSTIAFDDDGKVREYVGGYDDWVSQRTQEKARQSNSDRAPTQITKNNTVVKPKNKKSRLSYQQQLDLAALPKKIETLEQQQQQLNEKMSEADFYQQTADKIKQTQQQQEQLNHQLEQLYSQWEQLEQMQEQ